jgi:two-component sensor histidine kinase/ABC-type amino acid transport substrate-binding protein
MFIQKFITILFFLILAIHGYAQNEIEFTAEEQEWIRNHPVVKFGFDPNWPPFEMYKNGEYSGILADYLSHIEKRTGIKMQPVKIHSFKETMDKLRSGEIHVAPEVGKNSSRKKYLEFTETYLTDPQVIVTRIDGEFVKGLLDLSFRTVSQPEGYTRIKKLKKLNPNIIIATTKDVEESLSDVSKGKADAFVGSLSVVSYYINIRGYKNLKIASSVELGDIKFSLTTTKDWVVFRDISQKVFKNISKEDKRIIRNKWIAIRYDHGIDMQDVWNYIIYAVLVFLIVVSLFYYWNKTLRKEIRSRKKIEKKLRETVDIINKKNKEKDTLLKEIHHRVKNNLQMIQSLFNMQSRQVKNEYTRQILAQGKTRVLAISLVHELLYQSENFDQINIQDYIVTLKDTIDGIYNKENLKISSTVNTKGINLNIDDAIPLGLIINELLINSYKYAFENRKQGHIYVTIKNETSNYIFEYKDDGVGVDLTSLDKSKSLGIRLITRLASQLEAQPTFRNNNGMEVSFVFTIKK